MHRILINPARMQTKNSSEGNLVLGEYSKPFLNANYKFQFLYDSKKKCKIAECWYHNIKKTLNVDIIIESLLKLHHAFSCVHKKLVYRIHFKLSFALFLLHFYPVKALHISSSDHTEKERFLHIYNYEIIISYYFHTHKSHHVASKNNRQM